MLVHSPDPNVLTEIKTHFGELMATMTKPRTRRARLFLNRVGMIRKDVLREILSEFGEVLALHLHGPSEAERVFGHSATCVLAVPLDAEIPTSIPFTFHVVNGHFTAVEQENDRQRGARDPMDKHPRNRKKKKRKNRKLGRPTPQSQPINPRAPQPQPIHSRTLRSTVPRAIPKMLKKKLFLLTHLLVLGCLQTRANSTATIAPCVLNSHVGALSPTSLLLMARLLWLLLVEARLLLLASFLTLLSPPRAFLRLLPPSRKSLFRPFSVRATVLERSSWPPARLTSIRTTMTPCTWKIMAMMTTRTPARPALPPAPWPPR